MSRHTVTVHLEMTFDQEVNMQEILEDLRDPLLSASRWQIGSDVREPVSAEVTITDGPLHPHPVTWTVFGHWIEDRPEAELAIVGEHFDNREDDGTGENQPWSTFALACTAEEALAKAALEMMESLQD